MTTKVVKGTLWTLAGQVAPMVVAFIATPFTIRLLGSESYGVLLLVGLIPTYFGFADFGMGVGSTKFAAEAYAQNDRERERDVIWTATALAVTSALLIAVPIIFFSYQIVAAFNVPDHLLREAGLALKIASASFLLGILASVLNSPMLARMRMDLTTLTGALPRVVLAVLTPLVLYLGGGILGAVWCSLIIGVAALALVFYYSRRLLPALARPVLNRHLLRALLRFGTGWFVAMVAAMLILNLEKVLLTRLFSVKALAYYSVAFTFANVTTLFSLALLQSLVPAFAQVLSSGKSPAFSLLFARCVRLVHFGLLPVVMLMICLAKPFFTTWAGPDFGANSTQPFYILTLGLLVSLLSSVSNCAIVAAGRSDILAKLYWLELAVYPFVALLLITRLGILGAALAWSLRVAIDSICTMTIAERVVHTGFDHGAHLKVVLRLAAVLSPPVVLALIDGFSSLLVALVLLSLTAHFITVWRCHVDDDARYWIRQKVQMATRVL